MEYIEKEKKLIIKELVSSKRIKSGQLINYAQFLEIYEPYKDKMSEIEFARLLEISDSNYYSIKSKKTNARVLKSMQTILTEEEKEKIKAEVIRSNNLKAEQLVNYNKLIEMYEPYKDKMSEIEFARLLDISDSNYYTIKNRNKNAKVLKVILTEEEKGEIREEVIRNNDLKEKQLIDYNKFLEIYKPYKDKVTELEFSSMLGISYPSYKSMKNMNVNSIILKPNMNNESDITRSRILKEILSSGKIKSGQLLTYNQFLELYEQYKELVSEKEFSQILKITYSNYISMKNKNTRSRVLKEDIKKITKEQKDEIIKSIIESGQIKPGQPIDYNYFINLYQPFRNQVEEKEFAKMLEISESSYKNIKYYGERATTLRSKIEKLSEEEKVYLIEELTKSGKVSMGQIINYSQFLEIYEPYREKVKEIEFAQVIGITYSNYGNIKYKKKRTTIGDYRYLEKINRIKYLIKKESRFYSKEEIEKICNDFGIELDNFIKYICCSDIEKYIPSYRNILDTKRKNIYWKS